MLPIKYTTKLVEVVKSLSIHPLPKGKGILEQLD
jgi:hypothetical protein